MALPFHRATVAKLYNVRSLFLEIGGDLGVIVVSLLLYGR